MASVSVVHWTDTPRLVRPLGHFLFRETAHPLSGGVRSLQKLFFSTENLISASLSSSRIFFSVSRRHRSESERSEELQDSGKGRLPSKLRDVETRRMFLFGQELEPSGFAQVDVECSSLPWRPHHWQKAVYGSLVSSKRLIKYSRHEFRHYS